MDTQVIIFTNIDSLASLETNSEREKMNIKKGETDILSQNKCLGFDETKNVFMALTNAHKIIFVQDDIKSLGDCNTLKDIISSVERLIILKHQKPENGIIDAIKSLRNNGKRQAEILPNGQHEKNNGFYHTTFQILSDKENNKYERIVKLLGINLVLEAKLSLLLDCRKAEGAKSCIKNSNLIEKYKPIQEIKINNVTILKIVKSIANKTLDAPNLYKNFQKHCHDGLTKKSV